MRPLLYLDDDGGEDSTMMVVIVVMYGIYTCTYYMASSAQYGTYTTIWHIITIWHMYLLYDTGYNGAIASMICGSGSIIGDAMVRDRRIELVSFTGR